MLKEANELNERRKRRISLDELIETVAVHMGIEAEEILSSSRKRLISKARALISYLAICEMGYSGTEVSRNLDIKGASVSECVERGKKILENESDIRQNLIS